ncbi:abortive infection family protein [uncultured Arcobacter sp.]|uniref:abortive infection family protein n=1 Tax=uncultured Arcobacter sp. TaxID=165434 RepID=UPI00262946B6|nr:abortive infection family protein [uncultured Arcobacter sp.]
MTELKQVIEKYSGNFEHFEYYYLLIDKVEKNLSTNPDIAIECCKALIEGICTTILLSLDKSLTQEHILKNYNLPQIFKAYKQKLADYDETFELDFVNGFNHSVKLIGEIRTKRGDIAHGKQAPKEFSSSTEFAKFVVNLSSSLLVYSLEHFFNIEFLEELKYSENEDFNNFLDENNELPGKVQYSLALFEQYPEDYKLQLMQYLSDKEDNKDLDEEVTVEEPQEEVTVEEPQETVLTDENIIDEKYLTLLQKENSENNLQKLCINEKLHINKVLKLIDTYLFDGREPLSSDIVKLLKEKPKLLERADKINHIKNKIFEFIHENINEN